MVSTISDEASPLTYNPEVKQATTPGPASSGTVNNVGGLDNPTTSGAGTSDENRKDLDQDVERTMDTRNLDYSVSDEGGGSGSETSDEPEPTITEVGVGKPNPPTSIPDQGSDDGIEMDQSDQPNCELFSVDNMNISVYKDSLSFFKQKTADTEHEDNEDSDADMDNTQDEDSCVSNVAEITAGDLQPGMGISTPQPNKCELEQFLCDIKFKRKQIKLCREVNPDMRLLGNAILHHRKSITDPREAERLLGLAK